MDAKAQPIVMTDPIVAPNVPGYVGYPCVIIGIINGLVELIQGSIMGGVMSFIVSALGVIFLITRIRGQKIANRKNEIELERELLKLEQDKLQLQHEKRKTALIVED